jgi:hypothetical protein
LNFTIEIYNISKAIRLGFYSGLFLLLLPLIAFTQPDFKNEKEFKKYADKLFDNKEFVEAEPLFGQMLSNNPRDPEINYKYGTCIIFGEQDKELAVKYLSFASKSADVDPKVFFYLGKANHLVYNFNAAINAYNKFKELGKPADIKTFQVDREIEMCNNGKSLLRDLKEVAVLDKREAKIKDFFRFYDLDGIGGKILVAPEELVSKMDKKMGHTPLVHVPSGATTLYFSSYGEAGENGLDIYRASRKSDGSWSEPQKLPGKVNTPFDEDFPYMHPDGKSLYFSSKGHNSMGGYDIYVSNYNEGNDVFEKPKNIDFAINSADDDMFYLVDSSKTLATFASARQSKLGKVHVYRVTTRSRIINLAFIEGQFNSEINPGDRVRIIVQKFPSNETVGNFESIIPDGNYTLKLPGGGAYNLLVKAETGKITHQGTIEVPKASGINVYRQEITLVEVNEREKLIINNFFDETVEGADIVALARDVILDKASLNITADDFDFGGDEDEDPDMDALVAEAGFQKNLTNDDIVKMALEDAQGLRKEANDATQIANTAVAVSQDKSQESKSLKQELEQLKKSIDFEADPQMRSQLLQQYATLERDYQKASNQAITAFNLSTQLEQMAQSKANQATEAEEFAQSLKEAIEAKNFQMALAKLRNQKAYLEEYGLKDKKDPYLIALEKARNIKEKAEEQEALKISLEKEEQDIQKEIQKLNNDFFTAKKKDEKDFVQLSLDQTNEILAEVLVKKENASSEANRLYEEARNLEAQAEMLQAILRGELTSATVADKASLSNVISQLEQDAERTKTVYDLKLTPPTLAPVLTLEGVTFSADADYQMVLDKMETAKREDLPQLERLKYEVNKNWVKEIDHNINQIKVKSGSPGFDRAQSAEKIKELNALKVDRVAEIREYEAIYGRPEKEDVEYVQRGPRATIAQVNPELSQEILALENQQLNPYEKAVKSIEIREKVLAEIDKLLVTKQGLASTEEGSLALKDLKVVQEKTIEKDNLTVANFKLANMEVQEESPQMKFERLTANYEKELDAINDTDLPLTDKEEQKKLAKENYLNQVFEAKEFYTKMGGNMDTTGLTALFQFTEENEEVLASLTNTSKSEAEIDALFPEYTKVQLLNPEDINDSERAQLATRIAEIEQSQVKLSAKQRNQLENLKRALVEPSESELAASADEQGGEPELGSPENIETLLSGFTTAELENVTELSSERKAELQSKLSEIESQNENLNAETLAQIEKIRSGLLVEPSERELAASADEQGGEPELGSPENIETLLSGFTTAELENVTELSAERKAELQSKLSEIESQNENLNAESLAEIEKIRSGLLVEPSERELAASANEQGGEPELGSPENIETLLSGFTTAELENVTELSAERKAELQSKLSEIESRNENLNAESLAEIEKIRSGLLVEPSERELAASADEQGGEPELGSPENIETLLSGFTTAELENVTELSPERKAELQSKLSEIESRNENLNAESLAEIEKIKSGLLVEPSERELAASADEQGGEPELGSPESIETLLSDFTATELENISDLSPERKAALQRKLDEIESQNDNLSEESLAQIEKIKSGLLVEPSEREFAASADEQGGKPEIGSPQIDEINSWSEATEALSEILPAEKLSSVTTISRVKQAGGSIENVYASPGEFIRSNADAVLLSYLAAKASNLPSAAKPFEASFEPSHQKRNSKANSDLLKLSADIEEIYALEMELASEVNRLENLGEISAKEQKKLDKLKKNYFKSHEKLATKFTKINSIEQEYLQSLVEAEQSQAQDNELFALAEVYSKRAEDNFAESKATRRRALETKNEQERFELLNEAYQQEASALENYNKSLVLYQSAKSDDAENIALLTFDADAGFSKSDAFERSLLAGVKIDEGKPVSQIIAESSDRLFEETGERVLAESAPKPIEQEITPQLQEEQTETLVQELQINENAIADWTEVYNLSAEQKKEIEENPEYSDYLGLQARYKKLFAEYEQRKNEEEQLREKAAARVIQLRELLIRADEENNPAKKARILDEIEQINLETEELLARAEVAGQLADNTFAESETIKTLAETYLQKLEKDKYDKLVVFESNLSSLIADSPEEPLISETLPNDSTEDSRQNEPMQPIETTPTERASPEIVPSSVFRKGSRLQADVFSLKSTRATAEATAKEIPLNPEMPDGLTFSVQVGAFRNPVSASLFNDFSPIKAERVNDNLTRYSAGVFTAFGSANNAKNAIRNIGYSDAFVVAYLNGERIPLNRAFAIMANENADIQAQANRSREDVSATTSPSQQAQQITESARQTAQRAEQSIASQPISSSASAVDEVVNVQQLQGLFYTVQVGVFSKSVSKIQFLAANDLNAEQLPNETFRYSSGRFADVPAANAAKNELVSKGISDAFVTAYYNGSRISVGEAARLETQGVEPTTSVSNIRPVSVEPSAGFYLNIGTFTGEIPSNVANAVLELIDRGIEVEKSGDKTSYRSKVFASREEANQLKLAFERRGVGRITIEPR